MTSSTGVAVARGPLSDLLARIRREARLWICIESLSQLAVAAAGLAAGLFLFDWLLEPPAWARAAASAVAVGLLVWLLATRLAGRLAASLSDASLALAVERRHPALGDTLSTAVELALTPRSDLDHELVTRTSHAAAALAESVRPASVFRRRRLLMVAVAGLGAIGAVAGAASTRPDLAAIWGRRLVLLQDVPWPRRVEFEVEGFREGVRKVARGSDVEIVVRARAKGQPPESVYLRSGAGGAWQSVRMGTRGGDSGTGQLFGHVLERIMVDTPLEIRGGDGRLRGLRLEVVDPPTVAETTVLVRLPDYLGGGDRRPPALRTVPVPAGSDIDVRFQATKPLHTATITARFADDSAADEAGRVLASVEPAATGGSPTAIAARIASLTGDVALAVALTDHEGIPNQEPLTLLLTAVPDAPPQVALQLMGISTAITPQARLPLVGSISDDHGLVAAAVRLGRGETEAWVSLPFVRGGETLVEIAEPTPAVVPLVAIPLEAGDRLEVMVTATDGCGLASGPNTGHSDTWTLEVVTPDALRAMLEAREILLRRRYEAAIGDLTQARRGLDGSPGDDAARRLCEAAGRAAGESREIAAAFQGIRTELDHNSLLTPEVETRLIVQVADPVAAVAREQLAELEAAARPAPESGRAAPPADLASQADASLERMRAILARMLELESYNDVIEKLRGMIDSQEQLRSETLDRQRRQAREALEGL